MALVLTLAPTALGAGTSASISGDTGTINFDGDFDAVTITASGGNLSHGRTEPAFFSTTDWDTGMVGNQALAANGTNKVVVNGGDGKDLIGIFQAPVEAAQFNGQGGGDEIVGSPVADIISGGAGDDELTGDSGPDLVEGGADDDTMIWTNGDGSDVNNGGDGTDTVLVQGSSSTTGDVVTVAPNGARVKFDRAAPGAFSLDIGTSEKLDVRGNEGNDTLTTADGLGPFSVLARGGSGNDNLSGADGGQTLLGGSGNDVLAGGTGGDLLDGEDGDDDLRLEDGAIDVGRCGPGNDSASADIPTIDALDACETATFPAPDTIDLKGPGKVKRKRTGSFSFSSSQAGSTFTCAIDTKAAQPCESPFKVRTKKLKVGRHTLTVLAIGPGGTPDPSAATKTFRVKKP